MTGVSDTRGSCVWYAIQPATPIEGFSKTSAPLNARSKAVLIRTPSFCPGEMSALQRNL